MELAQEERAEVRRSTSDRGRGREKVGEESTEFGVSSELVRTVLQQDLLNWTLVKKAVAKQEKNKGRNFIPDPLKRSILQAATVLAPCLTVRLLPRQNLCRKILLWIPPCIVVWWCGVYVVDWCRNGLSFMDCPCKCKSCCEMHPSKNEELGEDDLWAFLIASDMMQRPAEVEKNIQDICHFTKDYLEIALNYCYSIQEHQGENMQLSLERLKLLSCKVNRAICHVEISREYLHVIKLLCSDDGPIGKAIALRANALEAERRRNAEMELVDGNDFYLEEFVDEVSVEMLSNENTRDHEGRVRSGEEGRVGKLEKGDEHDCEELDNRVKESLSEWSDLCDESGESGSVDIEFPSTSSGNEGSATDVSMTSWRVVESDGGS